MPAYFLKAENGLIKIGCVKQAERLNRRFHDLQMVSPVPLAVLGIIPGVEDDTHIHRQFPHLRHHGEWFEPGQDLLDFIAEKAEEYTGWRFTHGVRCSAITQNGERCHRAAQWGDYCTKHGKKVTQSI